MLNEAQAQEPVCRFAAGIDTAAKQSTFSSSNREFIVLAVPNTLSAVSVPLVGLISTMVIGSLGDASLIGGVAISSALFNIVFFAFNFLRSGTLGLTAQAFGAGYLDEQGVIALRSMIVAVACGLVVVAVQHPLSRIGFDLMGTEGEIRAAGLQYFLVRIWAAPFALMNFVIVGWVMGRSGAVTALILQLAPNGLNIFLGILFVTVFSLGVLGLALATLVAELFTSLAGIALMSRVVRRAQHLTLASVFDRRAFLNTLQINADIFVRSLFLFVSLAVFTATALHSERLCLHAMRSCSIFFRPAVPGSMASQPPPNS
ncbi:hypothetical protein EN794_032620 [Mesorhizobium sp. M00.F.Ca.ET.151.01.1.1]|nr:hypothetical protein EN794_032620 [Mesorhizobium sp. M00.F.Ca.ET.151.01.1.1]